MTRGMTSSDHGHYLGMSQAYPLLLWNGLSVGGCGVAFCEAGLPSSSGVIVFDLFFDVGLGLAAVPGAEMTQGTAGGTIPCGRPSNSAWYGETWVLWGLS